MPSHFDDIAEHERHQKSVSGIWALFLILAAVAVVIGITTSVV